MPRVSMALGALAALMGLASPASADEMKLIFTTIAPPTAAVDQVYRDWVDKVNAAGKGVVAIDLRDGAVIATSANFYDRLTAGVMQISFGSLNYLAGKFRLSEAMTLPFQMDTAEEEAVVFWRLYQSGLLDSEFDEIVPLFTQPFPQLSLHFTKPEPAALDSLKGLKIIASGQTPTAIVQKLGGSPLSIALTDSYQALQRGTADGMYFAFGPLVDFKLDEVTSYHIAVSLGGGPGGVWMAKNVYLSLPPAVRKILVDNSGEAESRHAGRFFDQLEEKTIAKFRASSNQKVASLSPEQTAHWKAEVAPLIEAWAGIDAPHAQVLKRMQLEAANYKAGK